MPINIQQCGLLMKSTGIHLLQGQERFYFVSFFLPYWVNLLKCSEKVCSKPRKIGKKDIKFPWQS